ncbi:ATP-binding cassette subfamily C member 4-like [Antedon mediterranea]|uniref:ATP-binding cassette subfamily C member 4-like n=1 Tax=Antedon mediterranea TaxID=105859 RepID=UPI003AF6F147
MPEIHPYNKANWISKLFFWWLGPLFKKGYKKPLELNDMYPLLDENKTKYLTDCLEREWDKKIHKRGDVINPSLNIALAQFVWKTVLSTGVLVTIEEVCKIVTPLFVSRLVTYFSVESDITTQDAYVCASVIVLLTIVANAVYHPFYYFSQLLGMNVRVACSGLIYRKVSTF